MTAPRGPSWVGLAWAALPMLGCMLVLVVARLGQVRRLTIATARLVVQVLILGMVLDAVFSTRSPAIVLAIAIAMLAASAHAVGTRQRRSSWALRIESFGAMALAATTVMVVGTRMALGVEPWYEPRVVLPILGMILGNSVNGVALGAERLESELRAERDRVELRLSLGASARQAATPALRAAVAAALTPTIHGMTIAGIVAIPGMMTGQILAGAEVASALRYQILIYLLIAGTVGLSTLLLLELRLRRHFTPAQQLRHELLDDAPSAKL
jgi:putative ABC transport system permease protein